jgi:hypothetical protein
MNRFQVIQKPDGDMVERAHLNRKTLEIIGNACAYGSLNVLETIFKTLQSDEVSDYLNAMIPNSISYGGLIFYSIDACF